MKKRTHIIDDLYDYCRGELPPEAMRAIAGHLAGCADCRREEEELREILAELPAAADPGDELGPAYWASFADGVADRLKAGRRPGAVALLLGHIRDYFRFGHAARPLVFAGAGGVVAGVIIALIWGGPALQPPAHEMYRAGHETTSGVMSAANAEPPPDMRDYFRRSKMLLVGITNMKVSGDEPIDLSAERRYSRRLLTEARYLKSRPIDSRSAELISDLEKILIELSNLKDEGEAPNVEIIRGGIHQENLLFKIRIAESVFDSTQGTGSHNAY